MTDTYDERVEEEALTNVGDLVLEDRYVTQNMTEEEAPQEGEEAWFEFTVQRIISKGYKFVRVKDKRGNMVGPTPDNVYEFDTEDLSEVDVTELHAIRDWYTSKRISRDKIRDALGITLPRVIRDCTTRSFVYVRQVFEAKEGGYFKIQEENEEVEETATVGTPREPGMWGPDGDLHDDEIEDDDAMERVQESMQISAEMRERKRQERENRRIVRRSEELSNRIVGDLVREFYNTAPEEHMNQEVLGYNELDDDGDGEIEVVEVDEVLTQIMSDVERGDNDDSGSNEEGDFD